MEKKRSIGVTILSIFLIISGLFGLLSIVQLIMMPPDAGEISIETFRGNVSKWMPKMSPEESEDFNKGLESPAFRAMLKVQNIFLKSGSFKLVFVFNAIIGAIMLILGIGIFKLKEWSRKGIIVLYILFIPIYVIGMNSFSRKFIKIMTEEMPEFESMKQTLPYMIVFQAIMMIIFVALLIFWLARPKVKAEFRG